MYIDSTSYKYSNKISLEPHVWGLSASDTSLLHFSPPTNLVLGLAFQANPTKLGIYALPTGITQSQAAA